MTKPKFTPDPPPVDTSNVAEVVAWVQRNLNRIEDWWPKDFQTRLEQLELRFPIKAGTFQLRTNPRLYISGGLPQSVYPYPLLLGGSGGYKQAEVAGESFATETLPSTSDDVLEMWRLSDETQYCVTEYDIWYKNGSGTWIANDLGYPYGIAGLLRYNDTWYAFGHGPVSQSTGLRVHTSTDFVNWSLLYTTSTGASPEASYGRVASDGQGNFLVLCSSGSARVSTDAGVSWSTISLPNSYGDYAYYANGIWFITGRRDTIMTSTDLATFTVRKGPNGAHLSDKMNSVTFDGTKYRAMNGGSITELWGSDDGFSWSRLSTSFSISGKYKNMAHIPYYGWVAGGNTGSGAFNLGYSVDGTTWTDHPLSTGLGDVYGISITEPLG